MGLNRGDRGIIDTYSTHIYDSQLSWFGIIF